jgi:hypothetical protein
MSSLPGKHLDLLTDGVDLSRGGRAAVVKAVRRVMLSAHRAGIPYADIHALLTDVDNRKLASQIAHGKGGRLMPRHQREAFLRKHWADTKRVCEARPAWSREDALEAVEYVADNLAGADMDDRERVVLEAVLDLARGYGTTQTVAPVHVISAKTGISTSQVHRTLMRICDKGEWLSLAQRGNARTRRGNLYNVGPALLKVWGASPPKSLAPTTSHPPTSQAEGVDRMAVTLTIQTYNLAGLVAQLAEAGVSLADLKAATTPMPDNVRALPRSS